MLSTLFGGLGSQAELWIVGPAVRRQSGMILMPKQGAFAFPRSETVKTALCGSIKGKLKLVGCEGRQRGPNRE